MLYRIFKRCKLARPCTNRLSKKHREFEDAEMVDRERREHLAGDDEGDGRPRAEFWCRENKDDDISRGQCAAGDHAEQH
ncbi:MAG: hypothetical protein NVSMB26_25200 [Beijerinckiaceae bacterium]